ncbi:uncharacterized protein VTP21DRAFT_6262 [Calcarisporiella thermophila]|uniref:uncharacterized protein n=1 Tax=Calcarisporiella thermophila TaxID=911321 RepID=UPI0037445224
MQGHELTTQGYLIALELKRPMTWSMHAQLHGQQPQIPFKPLVLPSSSAKAQASRMMSGEPRFIQLSGKGRRSCCANRTLTRASDVKYSAKP